MFRCNECGNIFEEGEEGTRRERIGSFWGVPAYEEYDVCPSCRSDDFDEVENCEICGDVADTDMMIDGVCMDCIAKHSDDWELCLRSCENETQAYDLNVFYRWIFTDKEIEAILQEKLHNMKYVDCSKFLVENAEAISNELRKEKKNDRERIPRKSCHQQK